MKTKNLIIILLILGIVTAYLMGSGSGDRSVSVGYNFRFVDRDTNFAAIYGDDTVRMVLVRNGNNLILGSNSADTRGYIAADYFSGLAGISSFQAVYVNSSVGVTEDFYVEGDALITGYLDVQTQIKFPGGTDTAFTDYDSNDNITCNKQSGRLTTKSLSTAGLGTYDLTLTNSLIATTSKVIAIMNGSLSAGVPLVQFSGSGSGTSTIRIYNAHASTALNNTITINFLVIN